MSASAVSVLPRTVPASEWTARIDMLPIELAVGVHADELSPQPVTVSVIIHAHTASMPRSLEDCFDYEPLLRWLCDEWPRSAHVPLLESRVNEVACFVFGLDKRISKVGVTLKKTRLAGHGASIGVERWMRRCDAYA